MASNNLNPESCWNTARQCRRGPGYLICLTIPAGGLQVVWAAIMGQGSPFLSNLGIPTYVISVIWLAGPLSGALVQPYIGVLCDRSYFSWGRRRPFIIFGTVCTIIPMILLPWTREIASVMNPPSSGEPPNKSNITVLSLLAGLFVWALNISIQPIQVGIRALVVDSCLPEQQAQATSYVSCITAIGSILGYTFGSIDMMIFVPWLGNTQYQCVFSFASLVLIMTVGITCSVIQEKHFVSRSEENNRSLGILAVFRQVFTGVRLMPKSMKSIYKIQFCSWLGWFPFLFYITSYLGKVAHQREELARSKADKYPYQEISLPLDFVQQGNITMLIFATISLASNVLLHLFITASSTSPTAPNKTALASIAPTKLQSPLENTKPSQWSIIKSRIKIPWLTLSRVWGASHLFTSIILFTTIFTQSSTILTAQVSLLGISWAVTQWAPLALISIQMSNYQAIHDAIGRYLNGTSYHAGCGYASPTPELSPLTCLDEDGSEKLVVGEDVPPHELRAGAVMGIYNVSIAAPQIVAAIGSSGLFWIFDRLGVDDGEAVGWVIRLGGLSSLAAAWLALGIER